MRHLPCAAGGAVSSYLTVVCALLHALPQALKLSIGLNGLLGKAVIEPPVDQCGHGGEAGGDELLELGALDGQQGLAQRGQHLVDKGQRQHGGAGISQVNKKSPDAPNGTDMYPQFWTPRIGGIFMKYSYEYKKNCIELYRQGKWPETPDGIKQENFRISVRRWSRREKSCGTESLQKNQKKMWSADEKYELIAKVLAGVSITESAISAGVEPSLLSQWVRCYKMKGYQGLAAQRKGRPPKEPDMNMKKKIVPAELTPSEREELIRLRAENEYLRTENEVIKKRIALRREKFAAQLKAKKLHSSKNSEEKDTL